MGNTPALDPVRRSPDRPAEREQPGTSTKNQEQARSELLDQQAARSKLPVEYRSQPPRNVPTNPPCSVTRGLLVDTRRVFVVNLYQSVSCTNNGPGTCYKEIHA